MRISPHHTGTSDSESRATRRAKRRRLTRRVAISSLALVALGGATVAWAYLTSSGSGAGAATVGSLAAPTNVVTTYTPGSSTVHVTWTGVTPPGAGTFGYFVRRFDGPTPSPACGSSPASLLASAPTSCDDTSVAPGTYTYVVTAVYRTFTATSAPSAPVTVVPDSTNPDAPVITSPRTSGANSGTFSNGVFNASTWGTGCTSPATICGTASDNAGGSGVQKTQLEIVGTSGANSGKYWDGGAFVSGAPQFFDAVGTTSWSYDLAVPADGDYDLVARTFDNVGLQSSDTSVSVTIDTDAPTAGAPGVTATATFGADPVFVNDENVDLTDTTSDAGGSGVRSVDYFRCTGATGACTSGTPWTAIASSSTPAGSWPTTWSSPLPADGPYRLVAVATDNAGNVSDPSSATKVTVDTTSPSVSRPIVNGNP